MENIKEKIQKLLNLATSDNEYEAALALAKATELMNKWNLDQATVQGTKIETTEIYMPFYKWTSENQVLVNLLAKLCDGFCLFGSGNKQQDRFAKILISGRPRDLENFRYLYDFINTKMWKESEKYKTLSKLLPVAKGLYDKLGTPKKTNSSGTVLINKALSKMSALLVAAIIITLVSVPKPSISVSNWLSVFSRSSLPPVKFPFPLALPIASISSMKIMAGDFAFA